MLAHIDECMYLVRVYIALLEKREKQYMDINIVMQILLALEYIYVTMVTTGAKAGSRCSLLPGRKAGQ